MNVKRIEQIGIVTAMDFIVATAKAEVVLNSHGFTTVGEPVIISNDPEAGVVEFPFCCPAKLPSDLVIAGDDITVIIDDGVPR